jgi:hypothetical protein
MVLLRDWAASEDGTVLDMIGVSYREAGHNNLGNESHEFDESDESNQAALQGESRRPLSFSLGLRGKIVAPFPQSPIG